MDHKSSQGHAIADCVRRKWSSSSKDDTGAYGAHDSGGEGPEAAQHPEQAGLARAVGARHQQVGAGGDAQRQVLHQRRVGRRYHHCILECYLIVGRLNGTPGVLIPGILACMHAKYSSTIPNAQSHAM